jgi:putative oxidoreductase
LKVPVSPDWALVFIRLGVGAVFLVHGWPKITDLGMPIGLAEKLGYQPAEVFGVALAIIEFFGGLLLLLGLATRPAALLIALTQLVAVKEVHWACGFVGTEGCRGFEFNFVLLTGLVALLFAGAGAYSVDRGLARARAMRTVGSRRAAGDSGATTDPSRGT